MSKYYHIFLLNMDKPQLINRLKQIYNRLLADGKVSNKEDFAEKLEYSPTYVSELFSGRRDISTKFLAKVESTFDIKDTGEEIRKRKAFGNREDNGLISVPIAAQAGYGKNYLDPVYLNQLERIYVPGSPYRGDHFRYFEVDGDSMYPTLKDKMNVLGERVPQEGWQSIFNYYIYVLVLESQILIKRLYKLDERTYVAISDNEEMYPQFTIDLKDVKELWLVKRKLDWDMMPPKNFDIKIQKL